MKGREVVLLGGGTHVGVQTVIRDSQTGMAITQLTIGPACDAPAKFDADMEGKNSEKSDTVEQQAWNSRQFKYTHKPLLCTDRSFARVSICADPRGVVVQSQPQGE